MSSKWGSDFDNLLIKRLTELFFKRHVPELLSAIVRLHHSGATQLPTGNTSQNPQQRRNVRPCVCREIKIYEDQLVYGGVLV